jgi:gliding motility-associated-like protein
LNKARTILPVLLFFVSVIKAQINLVPNPGFDLVYMCPNSEAGIGLGTCLAWFDPTKASSDHFDTCAANRFPNMGIPFNYYGSQTPRNGGGYAGIYVYSSQNSNPSEYVSVELNEALERNTVYSVSFYVSLADSMQYAVNSIGAWFSKAPYPLSTLDFPFDSLMSPEPQVMNPPDIFLNDKNNWMNIKGTFIAQGGERFLTIGNFRKNTLLQSEELTCCVNKPQYFGAYYYLDDVGVFKADSLCIPNVFTPNHDGVNDLYSVFLNRNSLVELSIFDRWGKKVFETADPETRWDGRNKDGKDCDNGAYFIIVTFSDRSGKIESKKGTIQLIR